MCTLTDISYSVVHGLFCSESSSSHRSPGFMLPTIYGVGLGKGMKSHPAIIAERPDGIVKNAGVSNIE